MRLRSLFVSTLLATLGILAVSYVAFQAIASRIQRMQIEPTFERFDALQLEDMREAYETGGHDGLSKYIDHLNHIFFGSHYLLDAQGNDLVTGKNHAELLPAPPATKMRMRKNGHWLISQRSADGKYWFAAEGLLGRVPLETFLPYYFLVIGATATLVWLAAMGVVVPIRRIAASIAAFGHGNLSIRVKSQRSDEIGQLARSFNDMAERLERHIVSERRLLGDISHELRSPLARLKFAVKLARTSQDRDAAIDRIERDVNRISSLVSDIVEITTVEGDPAMRSTEPVDLRQLVEEVAQDCAVEADVRHCRLVVNSNGAPRVTGSRELLRRAVENVVRNAIRYSPDQASIDIAVEYAPEAVGVSVRDRGPGVPEESLQRIFDPFFRVEEARNTNGGGSGLGLSIAKRAMQAHNGCIVAENANPGLRVRIKLPQNGNHA